MKLLLVDDQPLFLEGLQNLLASRGVEVIGTAGDGFEALAKARELRPDVILMDVQMPRCNGLEATRMIKAEMPEARIVMLTVSGEDEDLFEAVRSGASDYLLKSLDADQFFDLLSRLEDAPSEDRSIDPAAKTALPERDEARKNGNGKVDESTPSAPPRPTAAQGSYSAQQMAIYQEIVDSALATIGASIVVLVCYDGDNLDVEFVAWSGLNSGPIQKALAAARAVVSSFAPTRISTKADVNRWSREVYLEGKSVSATLEEITQQVVEPRIVQVGGALAGIRHAFLCPVKVEGQVEGSITFLTNELLTDAQRRTCEAFARQASLTLENTRLVEALQKQLKEVQRSRRQLTMADERLRRSIAEMLHGRVQTKLLMAWHRLGECDRLLQADPSQARVALGEVRQEIDRIREQEIRKASHLLHPSIIRIGLVPAIRSLMGSFEGGLRTSLQVDPSLVPMDNPLQNVIPERIRLIAYRVVEEALTNAFRHAEAGQVRVSLEIEEGNLAVEVEDNGRGFDTDQVTLGLGLSSIAGRVDQVGGSWRIASQPGQGTWLSVLLPLRESQ